MQFYGRTVRQSGLGVDALTESFDEDVVRQVLQAIGRHEFVPYECGPGCGCQDHVLPYVTLRAMRLLAQEHEWCLDCEVTDWLSEEDGWANQLGTPRYADSFESQVEILTGVLSWSTELFLDFLCGLVQGFDPTDVSALYGETPGTVTNMAKREALERTINEQLQPSGWRLVEGFPVHLDTPVTIGADPVAWPDVQRHLDAAARELSDGHPADAATDIGTALQAALELAGCSGQTLGDQMKAARRSGLFACEHTKLGAALEDLGDWVAGVRNQLSDAHHGSEATEAEARLALAIVRGVAVYLLTDLDEPTTAP